MLTLHKDTVQLILYSNTDILLVAVSDFKFMINMMEIIIA